jgi:hypothetical protein
MDVSPLLAGAGSASGATILLGVSRQWVLPAPLSALTIWLWHFLFELCLGFFPLVIGYRNRIALIDSFDTKPSLDILVVQVKNILGLALAIMSQILCYEIEISLKYYYGWILIFATNFIPAFVIYQKSSVWSKLKKLVGGIFASEKSWKAIRTIEDAALHRWVVNSLLLSILVFVLFSNWGDESLLLAMLYPLSVSVIMIWAVGNQPHIVLDGEYGLRVAAWHSCMLDLVLMQSIYLPFIQIYKDPILNPDDSSLYRKVLLAIIPPLEVCWIYKRYQTALNHTKSAPSVSETLVPMNRVSETKDPKYIHNKDDIGMEMGQVKESDTITDMDNAELQSPIKSEDRNDTGYIEPNLSEQRNDTFDSDLASNVPPIKEATIDLDEYPQDNAIYSNESLPVHREGWKPNIFRE